MSSVTSLHDRKVRAERGPIHSVVLIVRESQPICQAMVPWCTESNRASAPGSALYLWHILRVTVHGALAAAIPDMIKKEISDHISEFLTGAGGAGN